MRARAGTQAAGRGYSTTSKSIVQLNRRYKPGVVIKAYKITKSRNKLKFKNIQSKSKDSWRIKLPLARLFNKIRI
jgi:ABC-type oligopeptide transport system ATPase subunit